MNKKKLLLIFISFILVGTGLFAYYKNGDGNDLKKNETGNNTKVVDQVAKVNEYKETRIHIARAIMIKNNYFENMDIQNLNKNAFMQFKFILNDEVIYDSNLIEEGQTINQDVLYKDKKIAVGNYSMMIEIYTYSLEKKQVAHHSIENVSLHVE